METATDLKVGDRVVDIATEDDPNPDYATVIAAEPDMDGRVVVRWEFPSGDFCYSDTPRHHLRVV